MSGYRGHLVGASVSAVGYLALFGYAVFAGLAQQYFALLEWGEYPLLGYVLALGTLVLLFGLWPDVDIYSMGQRVFYSIFLVADVFLIVTERFQVAAYLGLVAMLPILSRHRGWTHTWWAMLLVPSPLLILPYLHMPEQPLVGLPFYGAAVVGYLSHLILDYAL